MSFLLWSTAMLRGEKPSYSHQCEYSEWLHRPIQDEWEPYSQQFPRWCCISVARPSLRAQSLPLSPQCATSSNHSNKKEKLSNLQQQLIKQTRSFHLIFSVKSRIALQQIADYFLVVLCCCNLRRNVHWAQSILLDKESEENSMCWRSEWNAYLVCCINIGAMFNEIADELKAILLNCKQQCSVSVHLSLKGSIEAK